MKAVRMIEVNHPLEMQELPMPTIGVGEALVRMRAAGI